MSIFVNKVYDNCQCEIGLVLIHSVFCLFWWDTGVYLPDDVAVLLFLQGRTENLILKGII